VGISWTALLLALLAFRSPEIPTLRGDDRSPAQQSGAPSVSFWYGDTQTLGAPGDPQRWFNVLGQASAPSGLLSLRYRLNGGSEVAVPWGPDRARLITGGDFNIELDRSELDATNELELIATSNTGETARRTLVLRRQAGRRVPLPYFVDFRELLAPERINDVAAVVDGAWSATSAGVTPTRKGYDRLIAVGDRDWPPEYEVVARFSLADLRPYGGVGVAIGWQGHAGTADPRVDWPLEALGWVRSYPEGPRAQVMTFERGVRREAAQDFPSGASYVLRARSERLGDGQAHFAFKLWRSAQPEPAAWTLEEIVPERRGSVLLVAHHADVTWQEVAVTGLDDTPDPRPAGPIQSDSFSKNATLAPFWRAAGAEHGASMELEGGQAVLRIPAGAARPLGGAGDALHPLLLLQAAPDGDFVLETRFDSSPTGPSREQGLVVLQEDGTSLRVTVAGTAAGVELVAAHLGPERDRVFGAARLGDFPARAPHHLRLERTGDLWRARFAEDGVRWSDLATFSLPLAAAEVGLYAATSDSQQEAFAARASYFLELSDAERASAFNRPPRFTSPFPEVATPGRALDHPMESEDPDADPTRVEAVVLPSWIPTARGPGEARLRGTPALEDSGPATVCLQVFDAHGGRHVETGTILVTPRAAASVVSDDFSEDSLSSPWRLVDLEGAATLSFPNGGLRVRVEPGPQRDLWPGRLAAPRLLQPLADGDVSVLGEFGALGPGHAQSQGLVLQEASDSFLRCGPYVVDGEVRILTAWVRQGELRQALTSEPRAPAHWVRLTRLGAEALCEYSADGRTWHEAARVEHDLAVTAGGAFFGHSAAIAPEPFEAQLGGFFGQGALAP
jgi:regulation of enolase protein 1 (concanavalin A-like superfamily)